ncbi:hypothetical protein EV182_003068 [Spiromyces aspiralis]|uniref:Uncharacterized protein n=1 Tax=Spiromyces aspiralis TaxID=68401 RepID=A0ACC1HKU7_9FUNG|nr:hypothetical protein EV182_003068 [Spiromyces aspiralis]
MQVPLAKIEATPLIRATKRKGTPLASWAAKHARKSVVPSGVSGAMAVKGKSRPSAGGMRRRRSTFGIRGKRASSIGSGFSVHPHSSVNTSDFYRHVSPELPEPVRLRQLIMWCTRRIDVQTLILGKTPLPIVGQVIEEMQDMLEKGNVYLSWYRRSIDHDSSELQRYIVTQQQQQQQQEKQQPHPLNIKNAERRDRLLKVIEDLKNEESSWRAMLGNVSDKHARTLDRLPNALKRVNLKMPVPTDLSFELVEGGNEEISAEKWRARLPSGISEILDRVDSQLQQRSKDREVEELTRDVEFWIDSIGYRVYQARQQQQGALESIEKAGRELSSALEQRARNAQAEARPQSSGAGMPSDPMNLLRALSRSSASSGQ